MVIKIRIINIKQLQFWINKVFKLDQNWIKWG